MMSYDNYHFTTKVTTMHNADYELVGDNRNILLGGLTQLHVGAGPVRERPYTRTGHTVP